MKKRGPHVIIATVVCGSRLEQVLVMIKSAVLFKGESQLTFLIFAELSLHADLHTRVSEPIFANLVEYGIDQTIDYSIS